MNRTNPRLNDGMALEAAQSSQGPMPDDDDFVTMTELGVLYRVSAREVGKTLKEAKMRAPDGLPTTCAIELGLTRKFPGPQPWIPLWKWHRVKILPYLEYHGLEKIEAIPGGV